MLSKQFFDFSLNFVFENFTSSKWPTKNFLKSSTMTTIAHQYQLEGAPKKWGKRGAMGQVFNFQYFPIPPLSPHFFGAPSNWYWWKNTKPFLTTRWFSNYLQLSKILRFFRAHSISCIQLKLLQKHFWFYAYGIPYTKGSKAGAICFVLTNMEHRKLEFHNIILFMSSFFLTQKLRW